MTIQTIDTGWATNSVVSSLKMVYVKYAVKYANFCFFTVKATSYFLLILYVTSMYVSWFVQYFFSKQRYIYILKISNLLKLGPS